MDIATLASVLIVLIILWVFHMYKKKEIEKNVNARLGIPFGLQEPPKPPKIRIKPIAVKIEKLGHDRHSRHSKSKKKSSSKKSKGRKRK